MGINFYSASLIEKSNRLQNRKLLKNLVKDLSRSFKISRNEIISKELNTFLFFNGKAEFYPERDHGSLFNTASVNLQKVLEKYYSINEKSFQSTLKSKKELQETSKIITTFLKQIDPNLAKLFQKNGLKIKNELPMILRDISSQSFIFLGEVEETKEYYLFLSALENKSLFTEDSSNDLISLSSLVDKFLIINFLSAFLDPTIDLMTKMNNILDQLETIVLDKEHYKTSKASLQQKADLFFRILITKLNALQDLDQQLLRILNLFETPKSKIGENNFLNDYFGFKVTLNDLEKRINTLTNLLSETNLKIVKCQECLCNYDNTQMNGVKILESFDDYKNAIEPLARLSVDVFVEAEILKMWIDFFGYNIPYFSFSDNIFESEKEKQLKTSVNIDKNSIIAARGLFKNYNLGNNTVYALRGVNLDIKEGEFVAIIGSSGAGKTTLLNCLAGLDNPDSGVVYFKGKNLHKLKDKDKSKLRLLNMGFIFQNYALLPHFTARENVALPAEIAGFSNKLKKRIDELLEGVDIKKQSNQFPSTLSGGQMQRVAIARALTNHPDIIFADEPTGDLDSITGKQVMELLKLFHEETGTTIIIITHEKDIAKYAERQVKMKDGVIIENKF
ncbi:MAG: ABC transporter ATP-binding protein [Candidatus Hodarchaeales archaeon]